MVGDKNYFLYVNCHTLCLEHDSILPPEAIGGLIQGFNFACFAEGVHIDEALVAGAAEAQS